MRRSIEDLEDGPYVNLDAAEARAEWVDDEHEEEAPQGTDFKRSVPHWALPLMGPKRFKLTKGGRGSGKSHEVAEELVEDCVADPDLPAVCIREVQRSMRFSSKRLIEAKIRSLGVSHLFNSRESHIERVGGTGVILFQGMQDHTADSIKSLEGFRRAWIEEASSISALSLEYLIPTMREDGAEIWATWNPQRPTDAIEQLARQLEGDDDAVTIHVNYDENPHLPETLYKEAQRMLRNDPEAYQHVYMGQYNTKSKAQIFNGKYRIDEFWPQGDWDGPYHGVDWGFSQDPTAAVRVWVHDNKLYIELEAGRVGLENDDIAKHLIDRIPHIDKHEVRADSARPETIAHVKSPGRALQKRACIPRIVAVQKWPNSVEDGIAHMRSYDEIVIHPQCTEVIQEFALYAYKVDKRSGDVLATIVDKHNHYIDAIRYALAPLIKRTLAVGLMIPKRLLGGKRP